MTFVTARHALLPTGLAEHVVVELDGATITAVRPATSADPPAERGLLVPGLVNAHLHLELSWAHGKVPAGLGLPGWVSALMSLPRPPPAHDATLLADAGTALVCDVSNGGDTGPALEAAGLAGVVQHERLGFAPGPPDGTGNGAAGRVVVRDSPHAVYSTAPHRIVALTASGSAPASIHLAEDPAEDAFTRTGTGPFADLLDRLGRNWRWWTPPGCSPTAYLHGLGVLGPGLLVVHGVHLDDADRALLASSGSPLCLCPRSNLHVGGRLPDVPALLAAGVRLCLGTDSLGSAPDLDVLGEVPVLAQAFPEVPLVTWLRLATEGGADALWAHGFGRIAPGAAPRLVLLDVDDPRALAEAPPPRRVL